ncbi:MerR family transcriptional regulator [Fibrella aquatilis]|uniref:MerR family transcriptional regulator n=1 Tax=Fibrella aquatilis TaxID=2817059 RepID=A0A939G9X7_9BACT|nr:MerR family transcriptional regulator [Fibrella aquatilis]MBO0932777.1 MerR family transcriptional regulator [Fibrella aquatilis]
MLIGELSSQSGFSRDTIRYYEKLGLLTLPRSARRTNNYKEYTAVTLARLRAIRALKDIGFTLLEIQQTIQSFDHEGIDCAKGVQQIRAKLVLIDEQISQLQLCKRQLLDVLTHCSTECQVNAILHDIFHRPT